MSASTHKALLTAILGCAVVLTLIACGAQPAEVPETSPVAQVEQKQNTPSEPDEDDTNRAEAAQGKNAQANSVESEEAMRRITITVNGQVFEAELADSDCGRAFADLLPAELEMSELNGNEKYCYTDTALPSNPSRPGRIEAGDLMLYGSDCVVLFYESFDTSYSYTRIARIENPEGIAEAVGSGTATVAFS